MLITYEIVPADVAAYTAEGVRTTNFYTIYTVLLCVLVVAFMLSDMMIAVVAVAYNDGTIHVGSFHMLPRLLIAWGIILGIYISGKLLSRKAARKMKSTAGKNGFFCEHQMELDEKGFTESTHVNRSFNSWEGVDKVTETASYIIFQIRLGPAYIIPKRSFNSKADLRAFFDALPADLTKTLLPVNTPANDY